MVDVEQIIEKPCKGICGLTLPIEAFPFSYTKRKDGSQSRIAVCLDCRRSRIRASYMRSDLETRRAKVRECHARRTAERLAYNQRYVEEHKEQVAAYAKGWREKRRDEGYFRTPHTRARRRAYNARIKLEVFNAYGGAWCRCCAENIIQMLTLDHVAGNGSVERSEMNIRSSTNMYLKLKAQGFPPGYQVLCNSCNLAKHLSGVNKCPHEIEREALWQLFLEHAAIPMAA